MSTAARMRSRSRMPSALVVFGALCLVWVTGQADAGAATVKRFGFTGAVETFVVPDGVSSIHVVAIGGKGGRGAGAAADGGFGALATADLAVTPGQQLLISVGGNGADATNGLGGAGGFNRGGNGGTSGSAAAGKGGGGGGGWSEVYRSEGLLAGFVIAAGGGGSGGGSGGGAGGGGAADGTGNGQSGTQGSLSGLVTGGIGGGGGTAAGGGTNPGVNPGDTGTVFQGGAGRSWPNDASVGAGGGGGGGLFGGAGGASSGSSFSNGGGGGAGTSVLANGFTTNTSFARDTTGVPSITFTFDVPSTPSLGGSGPTGGPNGTTTPTPVLTRLKLSPAGFAAASRGGSTGGVVGTEVTYTASVAGTTTFTVLARRRGIRSSTGRCVAPRGRRGRRCTRHVSVGTFTRTDVAGFNTFVFTGRVGGRRLPAGSYRLRAVSRANGRTSAAVTVSFRIRSLR